MQESFKHYYKNLKHGFLFGGYLKYMQPLNIIKNYYGENYAFEYAFLIHYQAWLQIPTYTGILLCIYQAYRWFTWTPPDDEAVGGSERLMYMLDTPMNAPFGLFVTFWATCFVASWKQKQGMIQFLWSCSDNSFSSVDERTEQFKFYNVYNPYTN